MTANQNPLIPELRRNAKDRRDSGDPSKAPLWELSRRKPSAAKRLGRSRSSWAEGRELTHDERRVDYERARAAELSAAISRIPAGAVVRATCAEADAEVRDALSPDPEKYHQPMNQKIAHLKTQAEDAIARARRLAEKAAAQDRNLTDAEQHVFDSKLAEAKGYADQIKRVKTDDAALKQINDFANSIGCAEGTNPKAPESSRGCAVGEVRGTGRAPRRHPARRPRVPLRRTLDDAPRPNP